MLLNKKNIFYFFIILFIIGIFLYLSPNIFKSNITYSKENPNKNNIDIKKDEEKEEIKETPIVVNHIKTPDSVRALYMSGWVAGSLNFRNSLIKMIDETELNAVVVDIKDSTGQLSFSIDEPEIKEIGSATSKINDLNRLIELLHSKNIYIIGRISVFQDPFLAKVKPEWAVKKISDGSVWKDRKGLSFLDPTNKNVHDYTILIAKSSYNLGFDEINLDYIRYPSDGNIKDINYNLKDGKSRSDNLELFFKYFNAEIKKEVNIPISADVFGLTTEAKDDMGIGQVWEKAIPYFDFICPMVYPSHYPSLYSNYKNPSLYPYEVINKALASAVVRSNVINENILKIRPWLQDFDMGATYTADMVKAQIKAVYDNKLNSWMLWDPSNKYTESALISEIKN